MTNQDAIFFKREGNQWFKRNKAKVEKKEDGALFLLQQYNIIPKKVLEIGCSNGWRLAKIRKKYGCKCVGIDPSLEAINDGKKKYPDILLKRGLASTLPLKENFDVVIIYFVLHWISRETLLKSIAEIDRVVADGGYLMIGDFSPDVPTSVAYHHLPGKNVNTYKLDYANIFNSTFLYTKIASMTFEHDKNFFSSLSPRVSSQDRAICSLLRKSLNDFYQKIQN